MWAPALGAAEPDERTRHAARELAREGAELFEAGDNVGAVDRLRRAYSLVPAPTIALLEARALAKLGRLIESAEAYERARRTRLAADASDAFRSAIADASKELPLLKKRIPRLTVKVVGSGASGASIELDGKPLPPALVGVEQPVDPGEHHAVARGATTSADKRFQLAEGAREVVQLELGGQPAPAPADGPTRTESDAPESADGSLQRTLGWIGIGVGVVGIGAGVGFALSAQSTQSDLDAVCSEGRCPASAQDDIDAFERARTLSVIGYGIGVVGVGVGATLVLTAPSPAAERAALTPFVGLGSAGVRGRF